VVIICSVDQILKRTAQKISATTKILMLFKPKFHIFKISD
jgi:predicted rRNA methylase YqxC with S4 and FtsJ domains